MGSRDVFHIIQILVLPVVVLAINQLEIIEESLPNAGNVVEADRIPHYREVLHLTGRQHIRFALKSGGNPVLLLSKTPANSIVYSTDHDYAEVGVGYSTNTKCCIRIGIIFGTCDVLINTPNILDSSTFKYFWLSWFNDIIKLGHGFIIGQDIIIEKSFPSTDVKYLALFNGWGFSGDWKLYAGIYY